MVLIWLNSFLSVTNNVSSMQIVFVHYNVVKNNWWIKWSFTHKWKFCHSLLTSCCSKSIMLYLFSLEHNKHFYLKNLYTGVFYPFIVTMGVILQKRTKPYYKNSSYALCHLIALCVVTPNLGSLQKVCQVKKPSVLLPCLVRVCNAPVQKSTMEWHLRSKIPPKFCSTH